MYATRYRKLGIKCPREMVSHRNNRDNWSGFKWTLLSRKTSGVTKMTRYMLVN